MYNTVKLNRLILLYRGGNHVKPFGILDMWNADTVTVVCVSVGDGRGVQLSTIWYSE